jgi:chromobox protein 1
MKKPQENDAVDASWGVGSHPVAAPPPTGVKKTKLKPPTGIWEDEVVGIDACEGSTGAAIVYLTWKGGHKSTHSLAKVYKKCLQKVKEHDPSWKYSAN